VRKTEVDASVFLLAAIVLLLGGGVFFTITTLNSDPIKEALSGDKIINTLFIIEHGGKPLGSYVLMYYPATKRATVIDVPGEVGLIIQRINRVDRIDSIYDPHKITAFQDEIAKLLGTDIQFSIIFDTKNLGKIVDLVEGVELFIPSPVEVYQEDGPILFPSGINRLDGDKVQLYITYQLPEEDADLIYFRRQRFFLGFVKRLGEQNEALKDRSVARIYRSLVKTGMNRQTRVRLFDELANVDVDKINLRSVGGNIREVSGQRLLFPYDDGRVVKDIVLQAVRGLTLLVEGNIAERKFTVEVLNGTTSNGLAGRTADLLRGFGYDVVAIGNADRNDYEVTEIIDHSGYEEMVRNFGDIIQCKNIRFETPEPEEGPEPELAPRNIEYKSDFTLIIGRDFNGRNITGG
jgi:anionic cell wall polymer biosynthesis LytR-Cps2A-Psr (LCP) family protein